MDWLERFSPMTVHWLQKWLRIPYDDQHVVLQGASPKYPDQVLIQLCLLTTDAVQESPVLVIPTEVQALIDQYAPIF